jgi:cytosine/adenosine deaminase-related metal-dependent hydrolase
MFCLCCRPPGGFFAEGVAEPVLDFARALKRRTAYERRTSYSRAPATHPGQIEFVIRDVGAITMDAHLGNPARTDLHVRDGVIVDIGRDLPAPSAIEIDGAGLTALPGLVTGHRHPVSESLDVVDPHDTCFGEAEPADIYRALRLALLDMTSAGFTSVHVCGADLGAGHAETAVLAQIDSGTRGRFSYPFETAAERDPKKAVRELHETWFTESVEHLLELGLTGDGPDLAQLLAPHGLPLAGANESDVNAAGTLSERTIGAARRLGLDQWIGSLSPGKRADLILIRGEPTEGFAAESVTLVAIDGRIRKRNGVLTEPNEGLIRREGAEAVARLGGFARLTAGLNVELRSE